MYKLSAYLASFAKQKQLGYNKGKANQKQQLSDLSYVYIGTCGQKLLISNSGQELTSYR